MIPVSPNHSPRAESPTSPRPPSTTAVKTVARELFSKEASESAPPLTIHNLKILFGKYHEAQKLLKAENLVGAEALFLEILGELPGDLSIPSLIFRAACKIGAALSSSEGGEVTKWAIEAKKDLNAAYDNIDSGGLNEQEKIRACARLRSCLREFKQKLIPGTNVLLHQEFQTKIDECTKKLPSIFIYYEKLEEAKLYAEQNNLEKAIELCEAALSSMDIKDNFEDKAARGQAYLLLARLHGMETDKGKQIAVMAHQIIFEAYDAAKALCNEDESEKKMTYPYLQFLLSSLIELLPKNDTEDYPAAVSRLEECESILRELQAKEPPRGREETLKTSPERVSKEPAGKSWSAVRLFVAFTFSFLVIGGAFVFGRRLFSKID